MLLLDESDANEPPYLMQFLFENSDNKDKFADSKCAKHIRPVSIPQNENIEEPESITIKIWLI